MKHYRFADEPRILRRVKVRPVHVEERPRFDELLETKHYLSSARIGWDYLFGLKGNQDGILQRAERLLQQQAFPP